MAVIHSIICLIGLVGNGLVLYVYLPAIFAKMQQQRGKREIQRRSKWFVQLVPIGSS